MPPRVTPQQASQSPSTSGWRRVARKVRFPCGGRPAVVSDGTRMVTSTMALAMSRPATRSQNSGSSCTSCIVSSYDERAVAVAAVRRSQGHREIWSAGSKHHLAALEVGSRRQTVLRGQARQAGTTSADDRGHSFPGHPRPRPDISRQWPADVSAAAPGAAGLPGAAGQLPKIYAIPAAHRATDDCLDTTGDDLQMQYLVSVIDDKSNPRSTDRQPAISAF